MTDTKKNNNGNFLNFNDWALTIGNKAQVMQNGNVAIMGYNSLDNGSVTRIPLIFKDGRGINLKDAKQTLRKGSFYKLSGFVNNEIREYEDGNSKIVYYFNVTKIVPLVSKLENPHLEWIEPKTPISKVAVKAEANPMLAE